MHRNWSLGVCKFAIDFLLALPRAGTEEEGIQQTFSNPHIQISEYDDHQLYDCEAI